MRMRRRKERKRAILLLAGIGLLLGAVCLGLWLWLSNLLPPQKEAERWQGEGDMAFSQISCFLPADKLIGLSDVAAFRNAMMAKLKDASLDINGDQRLMLDAWSTTTTLYTNGQHGRGEARVIAVGGDFFEFHPLRLLSGDYIRQSDLMHDRILLSEEVAWLLFGGTDLQGMSLKLNGVPFMIAGVVEQEKDFASSEAIGDGMVVYMSYDGLLTLDDTAKLCCYEFVLAEPVKGFALTAAREKFPLGGGEIVCNSTRFEYAKLMDLMLHYGTRGVQTSGAILPYWENAARMTEDWAGLCCMLGTLLLIFPGITALMVLIQGLKRGKAKWEEETWPEVRDRTEEAVRVRQRRRWERKQGKHEKKAT